MLFVVSSLATYYVWWVLARSGVLSRPRQALYNRWPPDPPRATLVGRWDTNLREVVMNARPAVVGSQNRPRVSWVAKMVDCPFCCGFYLAGLVTWGLDWIGDVPIPALWWPAMVVVVALLARVFDGAWRGADLGSVVGAWVGRVFSR